MAQSSSSACSQSLAFREFLVVSGTLIERSPVVPALGIRTWEVQGLDHLRGETGKPDPTTTLEEIHRQTRR